MKKFKLNTPCMIFNFKEHAKIKNKFVSMLNKTDCDFLEEKNEYFGDLIHRLDWSKSLDYSREWVKFVEPYLQKYFKDCANKLGYQNIKIKNIWFQQYNKNGKHGWHVHGENYTGVYYVKFSKKSAKTELIDPFSQNKKMIINAKEGDIVIFPSYVIHRATEQKQDGEKIIVSFNLEFDNIMPSLFKKIDNLKGIKLWQV
jgi:hypothetical protein